MSTTSEAQRTELERGVRALGLELSPEQIDLLLQFLALLVKWNRVYNLSAVREPSQMVRRHLLDSLAVCPYLRSGSCIDVGSGAGLPGLPLAIARPDMRFCLLDSNNKKTRFMQQVVLELRLGNVEVVQNRVEAYRPSGKFDNVIARAFAALPELQRLARHLLEDRGQLMAMVAREDDGVSTQGGPGYRYLGTRELQVPGTSAERRLKLFESI